MNSDRYSLYSHNNKNVPYGIAMTPSIHIHTGCRSPSLPASLR